MKKGSVTIFALLSIMLVASALFALLEGSRYQEIRHLAHLQTAVELESVFAEYNTYLWEDYRLLACELSGVSNGLMKAGDHRDIDDKLGTNFYQFITKEANLNGYTRLTDGDGRAYIQAVAGYMEKNLLYESAKNIYNQYEGIKSIQNNSGFDISTIEQALKKINEEEQSVGSTGQKNALAEAEDFKENDENIYTDTKNPLEVIQDLQKKGILALVIEDTSQLSEKKIDTSEAVSNRKLAEECNPRLEEADWYDRVLLQQYFLTYMSNYMDDKGHSLSYELEYLIGGKSTDTENMKVVVNQLLGIREAANFLYLMNSPAKVEQARLAAVVIAGASVNPVLIEVVKLAVISAWAFAESILDVRALLTGEKIALLKSDTTWTMDIDYISTIGEGYSKAKTCKDGLTYVDYLGILLLFQEETELAKRGMDVQELTLREKYQNDAIYLDEWIVDVQVSVTYGYKPVFFSIKSILPYWNYEVQVSEEYNY